MRCGGDADRAVAGATQHHRQLHEGGERAIVDEEDRRDRARSCLGAITAAGRRWSPEGHRRPGPRLAASRAAAAGATRARISSAVRPAADVHVSHLQGFSGRAQSKERSIGGAGWELAPVTVRQPTTTQEPAPSGRHAYDGADGQAVQRDVGVRGLATREPRRQRVLQAIHPTVVVGRRHRAGRAGRRSLRLRRRAGHDRGAGRLGRPGGHVTSLLRGQGVRGGARPGGCAHQLSRLPGDAARGVLRVRQDPGAWRPYRGQRRQPRSAPLPFALGRRDRDPPRRPRPPAARRAHLVQAARLIRVVCLGELPAAGQPRAARPDGAGRHRQQGPVRPGHSPRVGGESSACRRRPP